MPRQSLRGAVAFSEQSGMVTHSDEAISLLRWGLLRAAALAMTICPRLEQDAPCPAPPNFHSLAPCDRLSRNIFVQATARKLACLKPRFAKIASSSTAPVPRVVQRADEKLSLELEGGESAKVRAKDVTPLHPGPLKSLAELRPPTGDVQTAWEILAGSDTTLAELAELAYGAFTPSSAWAAWQLVTEGLYFRGTPERIAACTADEVAHTQAARAAEAAEKQAWEAFVARAKAGKVAPEDRRYLRDVEDLAMGRSERSRVLKALAREESYENAHATLLEFGFWDETINPYPSRYGLTLTPPSLPLPEPWDDPARAMLAEDRRDLTHLPAFAIDDPWTDTPDDAVSFEPETGRLWVHVADAAALGGARQSARPGRACPGDQPLSARGRGADAAGGCDARPGAGPGRSLAGPLVCAHSQCRRRADRG